MASKVFRFLSSKSFVINLGIAGTISIIGLLGVYAMLGSYTHHGQIIKVPDLRGMNSDSLGTYLNSLHLRFKIIDSLYESGKQPGEVLDQDPASGSGVKQERTIYVSINSVKPPKVKMPDLVDVSFRQAEAILQTYGLVTGQVSYQPDLAKNAILKQLFKGVVIKPGTEIYKGSAIDLVLGDGTGTSDLPVPELFGLTRNEAEFVLQGSGLALGLVSFSPGVKDSASATVYKQEPEATLNSVIRRGDAIDIFLK